jgi:hypothetical protein
MNHSLKQSSRRLKQQREAKQALQQPTEAPGRAAKLAQPPGSHLPQNAPSNQDTKLSLPRPELNSALALPERPDLLKIAREVNPLGAKMNCPFIVEAIIARLYGTYPTATAPNLPDGRNLNEMENAYQTKFSDIASYQEAFERLRQAGDGAVAVLDICFEGSGHVVVMTNQLGNPAVIEGQGIPRIFTDADQTALAYGVARELHLAMVPPPLLVQADPALAPAGQPFRESELPQVALARLGLTPYALAIGGWLQPLLKGEQTDLMPMLLDGEMLKAHLMLQRAPDGTPNLKVIRQPFRREEIPDLSPLGLSDQALRYDGQLDALLDGQRTALISMLVDGKHARRCLRLQREPDKSIVLIIEKLKQAKEAPDRAAAPAQPKTFLESLMPPKLHQLMGRIVSFISRWLQSRSSSKQTPRQS